MPGNPDIIGPGTIGIMGNPFGIIGGIGGIIPFGNIGRIGIPFGIIGNGTGFGLIPFFRVCAAGFFGELSLYLVLGIIPSFGFSTVSIGLCAVKSFDFFPPTFGNV